MAENITYNTELEQLLKENSEECESLSILHRMSYEKYNKRSNYINIPVIILSSAIGFITGIDLQYDRMNIILGVGSVFVGIIKSVDTYFQLAKRAESHRICSLQFSQISKKLQIELTLHRRQRATAENMMNIVKTDIKNMQDIAPLIDDDIIELYNAKYRRYKRVKKPNFVNGLTEVKVNPYNNEREYEYASRHGSREASPDHNIDSNGNITGLDNPAPSVPSHHSQEPPQPPQPPMPPQPPQPPQPPLMPPPQNQNQNHNQNQNQNNDDNLSVEPVEIIDSNANNLQLLQMYQQLQAQSHARSQAHSQAQSQARSQAHASSPVPAQSPSQPRPAMMFPSQSPTVQNIIVSSMSPQQQPQQQHQSVSPATSVRSEASLHLGQVQTDPNGNQGMNI
jgi:hypothetical protein